MQKNVLYLIVFFFLISSCGENPVPEKIYDFQPGEGYFIANEGAYGKGNASVSFVYADRDSVIHEVYENANGQKIGDVLQSFKIIGQEGYLVVNNSGYIKVVDMHSFEEIATIKGFASPRYILPVSQSKAYVSDLYANKIWVLDLPNHQIMDSIPIDGWTEEMLLTDGKVYLTSPSLYAGPVSKSVYVIDVATDELIETIQLKANPVNILQGPNGKIHVFCQGDPFGDPVIAPSVHTINPTDHNDRSFKNLPGLPVAYHSRWVLDGTGKNIYLIYGDLFQLDVLESGLAFTNVPQIEANGRNFYGLAIHPQTGNIMISDAMDYNQLGKIYTFKTNSIELDVFDAGVIPGGFIWY